MSAATTNQNQRQHPQFSNNSQIDFFRRNTSIKPLFLKQKTKAYTKSRNGMPEVKSSTKRTGHEYLIHQSN
jgi:hypothetical protein